MRHSPHVVNQLLQVEGSARYTAPRDTSRGTAYLRRYEALAMNESRHRIELPDTSDVDMDDTALQGGINLIPVVGGTFGAAAAMVTKQAVKQRTEKFFHSVVDMLEELGIRVEHLEKLQDTFSSRLKQGILASQHTHQLE